jgi:NAD(P)-dependent dehydrogenase (short-subunit alcohol dehydrogenase family)
MDPRTARHALITGGASGMGLAIARALAALGVGVTIVDANDETLAAAVADGTLRGAVLDVRDRAGWARVKAEAEAALGPVDILINNAGISPSGRELADTDPANFDLIVGVCLTGVFNGVSTFAAGMRERGVGHIVNVSSMAGISAPMPGMGPYTAAKFGVVALSEMLRLEMEPHGVGVSVLCPGQVATSILENTQRLGGEVTWIQQGSSAAAAASTGPTVTTVEEVAEIVLKAISENAFFILTDPAKWRPRVEKRQTALLDAFDAAMA